MNVNPILGVAKLLVTNKKMKMVLLGAQLGYMGYKYLKSRKRKRGGKSAMAIAKSK